MPCLTQFMHFQGIVRLSIYGGGTFDDLNVRFIAKHCLISCLSSLDESRKFSTPMVKDCILGVLK
jgi:hypothetical protein